MPHHRELTGKTFQNLQVVRREGYTSSGHVAWLCNCKCGNTCISSGYNLSGGKSTSCGKCNFYIDLTNKHFDILIAIEGGYSRWKLPAWKCICILCGESKLVPVSVLLSRKRKSCKCQQRKITEYYKYEGISHTLFNRYKKSAEKRGLEFSITPKYIWDLWICQNAKCAISGMEINFSKKTKDKQTVSLDRIDSSKGYIEGNVQWVHKDINFMKQSYSDKYFIEVCTKVASYNKEGTKITGESCPECSSQLIRAEGCVKCVQCSWSKCS